MPAGPMAAEPQPKALTRKPLLLNKVEGSQEVVNMAAIVPKEDGVISVSEDRYRGAGVQRGPGGGLLPLRAAAGDGGGAGPAARCPGCWSPIPGGRWWVPLARDAGSRPPASLRGCGLHRPEPDKRARWRWSSMGTWLGTDTSRPGGEGAWGSGLQHSVPLLLHCCVRQDSDRAGAPLKLAGLE